MANIKARNNANASTSMDYHRKIHLKGQGWGGEMDRGSKFICNLLNAAINKSKAKCPPWPPNDRIYVDLSHIGWTEPIKEASRAGQDIWGMWGMRGMCGMWRMMGSH